MFLHTWAVVVSTIAVKRSNRAAALEAGRNGGQTNSTEFHLGQGEAGEGDSLSDLFSIEGVGLDTDQTYKITD